LDNKEKNLLKMAVLLSLNCLLNASEHLCITKYYTTDTIKQSNFEFSGRYPTANRIKTTDTELGKAIDEFGISIYKNKGAHIETGDRVKIDLNGITYSYTTSYIYGRCIDIKFYKGVIWCFIK
jgi:hypothetical protein